MKHKIVFLALLCLIFRFGAQAQRVLKALQPRQKLPAIVINGILNAKNKEGDLASYNDRLLLLDFWATSCGSCIESMPELQSLQQQFNTRIKIILIGYEKKESIFRFLQARKGISNGLPIAAGDTVLKKLFVHQYIPHIAWIDKGLYLGATGSEYVTAENIEDVLNGRTEEVGQKKDIVGFDAKHPLFNVKPDSQLSSVTALYSSVLSGYIPGLPLSGRRIKDTVGHTLRYTLVNHSVLHLYALALNSNLPLQANRRILPTRESNWVYQPSGGYLDQWEALHCYSYELTCPGNTTDAAIAVKMHYDVDFNLNLNGRIEDRVVHCFVLRDVATTYARLKPRNNADHETGADLTYQLNQVSGIPPVIDETSPKKTYAVKIRQQRTIQEWTAALAQAGIEIVPTERRLPMFILTINQLHL